MALVNSTTLGRVFLGLILLACYILSVIFYRLYLSRLSRIPGPRLAAATSLYAFYYDVVCKGRYIWEVEAMHKKYGPLVRIRPEVLHCNDPEFIDQVFGTAGKRREKYKTFTRGIAAPGSVVATRSHELHRNRRAALNPFFSKTRIRRLKQVIQGACEKVLAVMAHHKRTQKVLKINSLFKALTSDIITEYCFGQTNGFLDAEDLNEKYWNVKTKAGEEFHLVTFVPSIVTIMEAVPLFLQRLLMPGIEFFVADFDHITALIKKARQQYESGEEEEIPTVFRGLMGSKLPKAEKETKRLLEESYVLLAAGTDTTADMLTVITYHLLANPDILKRLRQELIAAFPDPEIKPDTVQVEALPYLTAVVEEGLRLNPSSVLRQERIAPDEELYYKDETGKHVYIIPRGTPIGMTAPLLYRNAEIYPSPSVFDPERFIKNPRLDRHSITFSRGSRRCLGMNLAYAELYIALAMIFRKYDLYQPEKGEHGQNGPTLELWKTNRDDVDMDSDHVSPHVRKGSLGVRLRVRS